MYNAAMEKLLAPYPGRALVAVHRGCFGASIFENTLAAFAVALRRGADMVELDLAQTRDGVLVGHHDKTLRRLFCDERPICDVPYDELMELTMYNYYQKPTDQHLERFDDMLRQLKDKTVLAVDRAWDYFDAVHKLVQKEGAVHSVVLKYNADDSTAQAWALAHPGLLYIPMVPPGFFTEDFLLVMQEMKQAGSLAAVEILPETIEDYRQTEVLHRIGTKVWCNSLSITRETIYGAGLDDNLAITKGYAQAWGRQRELGVDIIQTDWPDLLSGFIDASGGL